MEKVLYITSRPGFLMILLTSVFQHILGALDYAVQGDADKLLTSLEEIISIVRNMITALSRMHGKPFLSFS